MNLNQDYGSELQIFDFVAEPFVPPVGMRSPHVQTILSHLLPRRYPAGSCEECLFNVEDGVQILCFCHWQRERRDALTVIIVHGLEGSSESQYVLGTCAKALDAGMNVIRMNVRGCGAAEALCKTLYHSGMSGDVALVTREIIASESLRAAALVGFSMGGNQVLKLAGEWGSGLHGGTPPELKAVVAVSPAMDLSLSADALHLPANRIYEWRFLMSLKSRLRRKLRVFPDSVNVERWWWKSIRDFDDCVTAPQNGFRDAQDYYDQASASRVVDRIAVPTLILNSKDDPFIRVSDDTRRKLASNPCVRFCETEHGGHCAFLTRAKGCDGRWAERQVIRFLRPYSEL